MGRTGTSLSGDWWAEVVLCRKGWQRASAQYAELSEQAILEDIRIALQRQAPSFSQSFLENGPFG